MIETQHGDSVRSTLIITNAAKEHFGEYECLAENEVGASRRLVKLRQEDGPPLLVVVSAGIAGLLLTTVVLALGLACRRYHTGKEMEQWPKQQVESSCSSHSSLSEEDSLGPEYHTTDHPIDYQQFTGSKDLLASLAPSHPYSSPYLQSSTPTIPSPGTYSPAQEDSYSQQYLGAAQGRYQHSPASTVSIPQPFQPSPAYGNLPRLDSKLGPHDSKLGPHDPSWVQGFSVDVAGEELNTTSIGTHV